jgi:hypothetical protein
MTILAQSVNSALESLSDDPECRSLLQAWLNGTVLMVDILTQFSD